MTTQEHIKNGLLTLEEAQRIEDEAEIDAMIDIDEDTREMMKEIERDAEELIQSPKDEQEFYN